MTYWTLTESDIDRIAIGVGILGTGGGGSPYLQMLIAKQLLREGKRIRMIRPADLDPNAQIIGLGGIGAPTVSIEKMEEGFEGVRVLKAIEAHTGRKVDAVLGDEVGGGKSGEGIAYLDVRADGGGEREGEQYECGLHPQHFGEERGWGSHAG